MNEERNATTLVLDAKGHPDTVASEADYLQCELWNARASMRRAIHDTGRAAVRCADIRLWTKQYPLGAVVSAFALGFVASKSLGRSCDDREQPRRRSAARLRRCRAERLTSSSRGRRGMSTMWGHLRGWAWHSLGAWTISLLAPKPRESREEVDGMSPQQQREREPMTESQGEFI